MANEKKSGKRPAGQGRYIRFTNDQWALVEKWAKELGAEAQVEITPSQMLRKLVDQERQRRVPAPEAAAVR